MLLGLRKEVLESPDALEPRNLHNGATWPYPPAMIMRILDDEAEVVERCNHTIDAMQSRASPNNHLASLQKLGEKSGRGMRRNTFCDGESGVMRVLPSFMQREYS